jgi:hypothetical protein
MEVRENSYLRDKGCSTHRYHLIIFKFDGDEGDDRLLVVEAGLNVTRKEAI